MRPGDDRTSYRIAEDAASAEREQARLLALARWRDPKTIRVLSELDIAPGWHCLEVGAGSGSISRWLAERVVPGGQVLSVDVDLRFHCNPVPGMKVQQIDVVHDPLPDAAFDLVHARALLQHLAERELVLDRLITATKPGGWVVVEDGDWRAFDAQPLPEPLASVAKVMHDGLRQQSGWDPYLGSRLVRMFDERGLVDLDIIGETSTMHGNHESGNWWFLGIEHAAGALVEHGVMTREQIDGALAIVRSPEFVMMSPLSISVRGRVPG